MKLYFFFKLKGRKNIKKKNKQVIVWRINLLNLENKIKKTFFFNFLRGWTSNVYFFLKTTDDVLLLFAKSGDQKSLEKQGLGFLA
jgi:hypothetical protein